MYDCSINKSTSQPTDTHTVQWHHLSCQTHVWMRRWGGTSDVSMREQRACFAQDVSHNYNLFWITHGTRVVAGFVLASLRFISPTQTHTHAQSFSALQKHTSKSLSVIVKVSIRNHSVSKALFLWTHFPSQFLLRQLSAISAVFCESEINIPHMLLRKLRGSDISFWEIVKHVGRKTEFKLWEM